MLVADALSLEGVWEELGDPSCGALVVFLGRVRDTEKGRRIRAIRYEAYAAMAERELRKIREEARRKFGARALVRHRLGPVPVQEASLLVACAAPHRKEAFAAARFVVEKIKRDVPVWKVGFDWEPRCGES